MTKFLILALNCLIKLGTILNIIYSCPWLYNKLGALIDALIFLKLKKNIGSSIFEELFHPNVKRKQKVSY